MSEIPKTKFIRHFVYVFTFLSPFLLSYPFFMLYLIFFIPYILEILSFLSPVFITASILLFSFLPNLTNKISTTCPKNDLGFLLYTHHVVQKIFLPNIDEGNEEFYHAEALELYKTVFETSMTEETENHVDFSEEHPEEKIVQAVESSILTILQNVEQECKDETFTSSSKGDFLDNGELERPKVVVGEMIIQECLEEVDEFEYTDCKEVDKSNEKYNTETELVKQESKKKRHSRRRSARTNTDVLGRMSLKENEWKTTLACKLFEEKHVEGREGMDLLWETHEEERNMGNSSNEMNSDNEGSYGKIIEYYEDEEDEEEIDVHVCCLPALKFSRGKMNMGVGGRNIARISKLVKGIRWLRSVTKHGKKM